MQENKLAKTPCGSREWVLVGNRQITNQGLVGVILRR